MHAGHTSGAVPYGWRFSIYYVAVIITLGVIQFTGLPETLRVKIGACLCLQNYNGYFGFKLNPPIVNGPLWSLNYELLYYGLFVLLWRYNPRSSWLFGPALLAGVLGMVLRRNSCHSLPLATLADGYSGRWDGGYPSSRLKTATLLPSRLS